MAALVKLRCLSVNITKLCEVYNGLAPLHTSVRYASFQLNHYKPGPIPKNEEERRKAAAKYGIPVSKYETYENDGIGYGDYPKLPMISGDSRDDFYPWDLPTMKRNYNEPIHAFESVISDTRYDVNKVHRFPMWLMLSCFFGTVSLFVGSFLLFEQPTWKMYPPVLRKQYPGNGVVNYNFPESKHDAKLEAHH